MRPTGTTPEPRATDVAVQLLGVADAETKPTGLSSVEAARSLAQYGRNEIERGEATSPWRILGGQFASPVIWLLLVAAAIAGALGELADAIAIGTNPIAELGEPVTEDSGCR